MSWEIEFLNAIQHLFRNEFLDIVMPFISALGNAGIFWILLTVVLLKQALLRQLPCSLWW